MIQKIYDIIKTPDGAINVESKEVEGTTFILKLIGTFNQALIILQTIPHL
ncbi:MAG: hypothetical protein ABI863_14680 [Ginsengibacter sp.]